VNTTFYNQCTPGVGLCGTVKTNELDDRFWSNGVQGGCHASPASPCPHPSPPKAPPVATNCPGAPGTTCPGDTVVVTLTAAGAQVVTPLVRVFFANAATCQADSPHCYVPISSTVSMRFEGDTL
jgi:hypothetical protein